MARGIATVRYMTTVRRGVYNVWENGRLLAREVPWSVAYAIVRGAT